LSIARVALYAVLALTTGACGGDAPETSPQEAPPAAQGVTGRAPPEAQGVPSVVTLTPVGARLGSPPSEAALLDQLGLAFLPTQLVVRAGQTLRLVNSESLAHNVHIKYTDNDSTVYLADMDPGDRTEITLDREGGYDVTCDVHPGMRAFLFVTTAPYAEFATPAGGFVISGVPPGSYTASVWSAAEALRAARAVEIVGPSTALDLTAEP
jgi:plastocyanin